MKKPKVINLYFLYIFRFPFYIFDKWKSGIQAYISFEAGISSADLNIISSDPFPLLAAL